MTERIVGLIPALNAEGSIGAVIRSATPYVSQVVVVDDGSSDRTGAVAKEAGATVLRHEVNRGKGAALKTGFHWAVENGFDGVITLDADGQHLPSSRPRRERMYPTLRAAFAFTRCRSCEKCDSAPMASTWRAR